MKTNNTKDNYKNAYTLFCKYLKDINFSQKNINTIYIFYSGGKDASLLIDLFLKYKKNNQIPIDIVILTIKFPEIIYDSSDEFQRQTVNNAINFWTKKGVYHKWIDVDDIQNKDFESSDNPCNICEFAKIKAMENELQRPEYYNSYICLGHTLDDIVGYFSEIFFISGHYSNWIDIKKENQELFNKILKISRWIYLTYTPYNKKNNYTYIKPLMYINEKTINTIVSNKKYPLIPECCSNILGDKFRLYKRIINDSINWLDKNYGENKFISKNLIHSDYKVLLNKFNSIGIFPPQKIVENIEIR